MTSATTITTTTLQNSGGLDLPLCIFLALLAVNAISRMRKRVEPVVGDVRTAVVTLAKGFRRAIEATQRLVEVPEEPSLLTGEQERLLPLHCIGTLVGHVEGIRTQIAVRTLLRGPEGFIPVSELLENALALIKQTLLEVIEHLLVH